MAHARAGSVDHELVRRWLPPMMVGAVAGLALAQLLPPVVPVAIFALVAAALGVQMLAGGRFALADAPPPAPWGWVPPGLVGLLAAGLGIGAGTLSGPVLSLLSVPLSGAIGAGSVFNLVVALPAVAAFIFGGIGVAGRPPGSLGHIGLLPLALLVVPALLAAPPAAGLARRLPVPLLRRLFAVCLLAIAARMVMRLAG